MEDIFKFLFVIGIIAIGFVRQARKEAKTSTGNGPAMPMPDAESPFPENWNGVPYDGYSPENPEPEVSVPRKKAAKKHKSAPKQTSRLSKHRQYVSRTHRSLIPI